MDTYIQAVGCVVITVCAICFMLAVGSITMRFLER